MSFTRFRNLMLAKGDIRVTDNLGGVVIFAIPNQNLKYGEIVGWINAANTVDKSATAATVGNVFAGVVVGGDLTDYKPVTGQITNTTTVVATAAKSVLIQTDGICQMAAGAVIATIGNRLIGDATAGRVITGSTAGAVVGVNIEASSGADTLVKVFIMRR